MTSSSSEHVNVILAGVDAQVSPDQKEELDTLLKVYLDFFSKDEYDLGCTSIVQNRTQIGVNRPYWASNSN